MLDESKIFKFHPKIRSRLITRESSWLEFKESFNWGSKDDYGKTFAGFSNNKGGFLVFGVKNSPRELVGLQSTNFENLDEAKITGYLNGIFAPEIFFEKRILYMRNKKVGIFEIRESTNKPVASLKNDGEIKEGEIYYRYTARTDKIKYPELRTIIETSKEEIEDKWKSLLKNLGRIPNIANTVILDKIKGTPIRLTNNPTAPAYKVTEDPTMGGYTLKYRDVIFRMHKRSKKFKANQKFINLMKKLRANERFCRVRLLDPRNPAGISAKFYHPRILIELKNYYT